MYLRFVHSLDYYNHAEYPYEDDMPNRLGIMHGRGILPTTDVSLLIACRILINITKWAGLQIAVRVR